MQTAFGKTPATVSPSGIVMVVLPLALVTLALLSLALSDAQRQARTQSPAGHMTGTAGVSLKQAASPAHTYLGFDRNLYPGDAAMRGFRKTFSFAGYWLNDPPGKTSNSWRGKRETLRALGFGFLVLFNGRSFKALRSSHDPGAVGTSDAAEAVAAARSEGFPPGTIIFLDQEEGGRMLPEQRAYLHAWVDGINTDGFRAGVYCSGIPFQEDHGHTVITASDIREHAGQREIVYWVYNDACPPSPGCALTPSPPPPSQSGIPFASVWQFAQSPRRKEVASGCHGNYSSDGNCYAPVQLGSENLHLDLDSAGSADPSRGR